MSRDTAETVARGLGWFSIAVGAAEVLAPRGLDRMIGADGHASLTRAYGFREILTGIGILASRDPTPWIWARVAGDVIDLATLAPTLDSDNPRRAMAATAFANVAAVTAVDVACAVGLGASSGASVRREGGRMRGEFPEGSRPFPGVTAHYPSAPPHRPA